GEPRDAPRNLGPRRVEERVRQAIDARLEATRRAVAAVAVVVHFGRGAAVTQRQRIANQEIESVQCARALGGAFQPSADRIGGLQRGYHQSPTRWGVRIAFGRRTHVGDQCEAPAPIYAEPRAACLFVATTEQRNRLSPPR